MAGDVLIGREDVLKEIWARVSRAASGRGTITVAEGAPGIGKTHLAEAIQQQAEAHGFAVHRGAGWELEKDRAFGPLLDALGIGRRSRDPLSQEIYGLLNERMPDESTGQTRFRIAERIIDLVEGRTRETDVLLWLDDLQWADSGTLLVVGRLFELATVSPLALLLTHRPVEPAHDLAAVLSRSGTEALFVHLGPLDPDSAEELATRLVGEPLGPGLRSSIVKAGGNPLFIAQFISALQEEGLIESVKGTAEAAATTVPASFRLTALRRLAFMTPGALDVLRLASILGTRFTLNDLSIAHGSSPSGITATLEQPTRAGFITFGDDTYRFRHDLIREALYEDIPSPTRRNMHRLVAERFLESGNDPIKAAPHLVLGASKGDEAAANQLEAAADLLEARDPQEAVALLECAADLLPGSNSARLNIKMVQPLIWLGRLQEAEACARHAIRSLGPSTDLTCGLTHALFLQDRQQEARELIEASLEDADLPAAERGALLARLSFFQEEDLGRATTLAEEAIPLSRTAGDLESECLALLTLVYANKDPSEARQLALDVIAKTQADDGGRAVRWHPHLFLVAAHVASNELDEAEAALEAGKRLGEELGTAWHHHQYALLQALVSYTRGDWERAAVEAGQANEVARMTDVRLNIGTGIAIWATVTARRGAVEEAERSLTEIEEPSERNWADRLAYRWAQMNLMHLSGREAMAAAFAKETWDLLQDGARKSTHTFGLDVLITLFRGGDTYAAERVERGLKSMSDTLPTKTNRAIAEGAAAFISGDIDQLQRCASVLAHGSRPWESVNLGLRAAELALAAGARDAATVSLNEASPLIEQLGAQREMRVARAMFRKAGVKHGTRQTRTKARSGWDSITKGERAVLDLLAEGASNREIADQLFISKRTVEFHVGNLFRKLDAKSRVELAARALKRRSSLSDENV